VEPEQVVNRLRESQVAGVLVGRGALRNPWIFKQAAAAATGRPATAVPREERGQFLLDYLDLLLAERVDEVAGFRHVAPGQIEEPPKEARGRERWVINKLRALGSWYTKGLEGGADLRVAINHAKSIQELRDIITKFFMLEAICR
jgi:tRNA-dihydrouridine synthase B